VQHEKIVTAFRIYQDGLRRNHLAFITTVRQTSCSIDPEPLLASEEASVELQRRLSAVFLLPTQHPQLDGHTDTLYLMYADAINAERTRRKRAAKQLRERNTVIEACKLLILEGKPFTFAALCEKAGMHPTACNEAFIGGFKEAREIAFEELISETKAALGINDTGPSQIA
jgi:hypothetical protein